MCMSRQICDQLALDATVSARALGLLLRFYAVHPVGVLPIRTVAVACILLALKTQVSLQFAVHSCVSS